MIAAEAKKLLALHRSLKARVLMVVRDCPGISTKQARIIFFDTHPSNLIEALVLLETEGKIEMRSSRNDGGWFPTKRPHARRADRGS